MHRVLFYAYGHENIIASHRTTLEITKETNLTKRGDCIIGVRSSASLAEFDDEIKLLAKKSNTQIILRLSAGGISEEIVGRGSPGLSYSDNKSMVVRRSFFECDRTLMVGASKAAADIDRGFIVKIMNCDVLIKCELIFISQ